MGEISLIKMDEELADFVHEQVETGAYASESEVIEAALRLMREQESLEAIRAAIDEGEASGEPQPFDFDAFIEQKRARNASR